MATTSAMPKPADLLKQLNTTAEQIEADKGKDREDSLLANGIKSFGKRLNDNTQAIITKGGATEADIATVITLCDKWADTISPVNNTWDKETVTAQLTLLNTMAQLGFLSEDEKAETDRLEDLLSTVRKRGNGVPAARIANRPERVEVTITETGVKVANQAGDRAMSVANLMNAIKKFVEKANGTLTDEQVALINTAVKEVVTNGSDEQNAEGFTVRPVA